MVRNVSVRERLAEELRAIRREARVNQSELAELAGVSRQTVKLIEGEQSVPKVPTIRLLADGAATDGAGRRDQARATAYYDRLMRAAGYLPEDSAAPRDSGAERTRPVEDLTDEEVEEALTRLSQDPELSAAFLAVADDWSEMSPSARRFVLFSLREAVRMDEEIKSNDRRAREAQRRRREG